MTTQYTQIASPERPFQFQDGSCLDQVDMAWKSWGTLSSRGDNAILLFPVLTSSHHAAGFDAEGPGVDWWTSDCHAGWWDDFIGPDKALDTNHFCVICPSFLGGCYGSTGPTSVNQATGTAWSSSFPFPHISDLVDAYIRLLDRLGIDCLHSIVGASFGGYLALDFALRYPDRTQRVVSIASGLRVTPAMKLANFQQVMAIESQLGHASESKHPVERACHGLALARMIAIQQYIVADSVDTYCGTKIDHALKPQGHFPLSQPLESWLLHQGKKFAQRFDSHSYLRLLHAWQSWNLHFCELDAEPTFSPCRSQKWLVFSIDSDVCFPPLEQSLLRLRLSAANVAVRFVPVVSRLGHDSFIQEANLYTRELQSFFTGTSDLADDPTDISEIGRLYPSSSLRRLRRNLQSAETA